MFGLLDIAASGMVAQRERFEVAEINIASKDVIAGPDNTNQPFRRRIALLSTGDPATGSAMGVHVSSIIQSNSAFQIRHEPSNPLADADGNVKYPDIDVFTESINSMEAQRAYEANVMAAEAAKTMLSSALRIIA